MSNIEVLITDMKESLEREIRQGFQAVEVRFQEFNARFDVQEARLNRLEREKTA